MTMESLVFEYGTHPLKISTPHAVKIETWETIYSKISQILSEYHRFFSEQDETSQLSRLNTATPGKKEVYDSALINFLNLNWEIAQKTHWLFDPFDFEVHPKEKPYSHTDKTVNIKEKFNLSGVLATALAIDEVVQILKVHDVRAYIISNANLRVVKGDRPWQTELINPITDEPIDLAFKNMCIRLISHPRNHLLDAEQPTSKNPFATHSPSPQFAGGIVTADTMLDAEIQARCLLSFYDITDAQGYLAQNDVRGWIIDLNGQLQKL